MMAPHAVLLLAEALSLDRPAAPAAPALCRQQGQPRAATTRPGNGQLEPLPVAGSASSAPASGTIESWSAGDGDAVRRRRCRFPSPAAGVIQRHGETRTGRMPGRSPCTRAADAQRHDVTDHDVVGRRRTHAGGADSGGRFLNTSARAGPGSHRGRRRRRRPAGGPGRHLPCHADGPEPHIRHPI